MNNSENKQHSIPQPRELMARGMQIPADIVARAWGEEATQPYREWLVASIKHENATKWAAGRIRDDYQPLRPVEQSINTNEILPFSSEEFIA